MKYNYDVILRELNAVISTRITCIKEVVYLCSFAGCEQAYSRSCRWISMKFCALDRHTDANTRSKHMTAVLIQNIILVIILVPPAQSRRQWN